MLSKKAFVEYQKLQKSYRESLSSKHDTLENLWQCADESNGATSELQNLRLFVHRLAGSAASYGYETISKLAREMEKSIIKSAQADSIDTTNPIVWSNHRTNLYNSMLKLISEIDSAIK